MSRLSPSDWWLFLVRGVVGIIFGLFCLFAPVSMKVSILLVWGVFAIVDGITAIWFALSGKTQFNRWFVGLQGILGVLLGLILMFFPAAAVLGIVYYIAAWAVVVGVLTIVTAVTYRKEMTGEFWLGLAGLLAILFGIYAMLNPAVAALSLVWTLGMFAIAYGAATVGFAFRLKNHKPA
jgi:uncharacterized membrane protein HdeD (DUF308 family)